MQSLLADAVDFHLEEIAHRLRAWDTARWEGFAITRIPNGDPKTVLVLVHDGHSNEERSYHARIGAALPFDHLDVVRQLAVYGARLAR